MNRFGTVLGAAMLTACATALAGCGAYGPKGDRGLPPPPEGVAYPNLNVAPADRNRPLRSAADQQQVQADVLAGRRQARARR